MFARSNYHGVQLTTELANHTKQVNKIQKSREKTNV